MTNVTTALILALSIFISVDVLSADIPNKKICTDVIQVLNEGDLVFISNPNYVFRQVEKDTLSWASHVGIAFKQGSAWMVYESKIPLSKISSICDYVSRSNLGKVAVTRYSIPLTLEHVVLLKTAAKKQLNIRYDLGFEYQARRTTFCSKYVYNSYKSIGLQVGHLETLGHLLLSNPEVNLSFWRTWYLGDIPYERITITPASQLLDPNFLTVFTSLAVQNL